MERWTNKTAVVTGASAGIGAAICAGLADAGLRVVGLARRPELIERINGQTRRVHARKCDVSDVDDIAKAFEWVDENFGGVDVLVNNAGLLHLSGHLTDFGDMKVKDEDILATIDVNLKGLVICTRHAVASMKKRDVAGHIVNINSVVGQYFPTYSGFNIYPSTKHGVSAFSAALLNEFADFNSKIKVTSVSPGLVETDMTNNYRPDVSPPMLRPKDVADAVLYALSTPPHVNINELTITFVGSKTL